MNAPLPFPPRPPASPEKPPPLENGDHLTREEFERRYEAMPQLKKAELLNGVVHMPSPVSWDYHAQPHADIIGWLVQYKAFTPGVDVGDNGTVRLDPDSEPQPDAAMIIQPSHGGHVVHDKDDYISGAPDLIAEVSSSTVSIDTHVKQPLYLRCGVREYLIWRVRDGAVDWLTLHRKKYRPLVADEAGIYRSEAFPGLWLNVPALLGGDLASVLRTLQDGLATPEHAAFVEKLRQAAQPQ